MNPGVIDLDIVKYVDASIRKTYSQRVPWGLTIEDLVCFGREGLMRAPRDYDPVRGGLSCWKSLAVLRALDEVRSAIRQWRKEGDVRPCEPLEHLKRRDSFGRVRIGHTPPIEVLHSRAGQPDEIASAKEHVGRWLRLMPARMRRATWLRILGFTNDEIATEMGTTRSTIQTQHYQARKGIYALAWLSN